LSTAFTFRTIANPEANISEWHISYDQGFVRRGLRGELLEIWQLLTGLDWALAEATIRSLPVGLLGFFLTSSLLSVGVRFLPAAGLLFPLGPLYFLFDPGNSGTLDPLLLFLAFYVFSIGAGEVTTLNLCALFLLSAFVALLHEGYIFFIPLILAVWSWRRIPSLDSRALAKVSAATATPFVLQSLLVVIVKKPNIDYFCQTALERLGNGSCEPLTMFSRMSIQEAVTFSLNRGNLVELAFFAQWAAFVIFLCSIFLRQTHSGSAGQPIFYLFAAGILCASTLPIFLIGSDWGRWLSILYGVFMLRHLKSDSKADSRILAVPMIAAWVVPIISGTGGIATGVGFWLPRLLGAN
jgi:hypothetical protein